MSHFTDRLAEIKRKARATARLQRIESALLKLLPPDTVRRRMLARAAAAARLERAAAQRQRDRLAKGRT